MRFKTNNFTTQTFKLVKNLRRSCVKKIINIYYKDIGFSLVAGLSTVNSRLTEAISDTVKLN